MTEDKAEEQRRCLERCQSEYIRYTARQPAGGVEILRVCKERCTNRR